MKILKKVNELTEVDANLRVFYEEDTENGGYKLKSDEITATAISVISGLNGALGAARSEAEAAKRNGTVDLSVLADYGTDPQSIADAVNAKIEELSSAATSSQKDIEARISRIKKEHAEALAEATSAKDQEIMRQQQALHNYMLDTAVMSAATSWTGLNAKLVAPFARGQMKVAEIDGQPRVVVVDSDGQPRYSKNPDRAGEMMQADELLKEMSEQPDYRQLFPSQQASTGGGAEQTRTPVGVRTGVKKENMTSAEKINAGLAARRRR